MCTFSWNYNKLPSTASYPVSANLVKYFMILLLSSFSSRVWAVPFSGSPKTYSISSACITPIQSPHGLTLVRCNWKIKLPRHFTPMVFIHFVDCRLGRVITEIKWTIKVTFSIIIVIVTGLSAYFSQWQQRKWHNGTITWYYVSKFIFIFSFCFNHDKKYIYYVVHSVKELIVNTLLDFEIITEWKN